MRQIELNRGWFALVDDEDYEYLSQWKWKCEEHNKDNIHNQYARRHSKRRKGGGYIGGVLMHRLILGIENNPKLFVDHKNRNGLDNRKENLRIATKSQNSKNRRSAMNSSSQYLGVYWAKDRRKWRVEIKAESGERIRGGQYETEKDAAMAYDVLAKIYHGEFANLNFEK